MEVNWLPLAEAVAFQLIAFEARRRQHDIAVGS